MINKKEGVLILIISIIISFSISMIKDIRGFFYIFLLMFLIILINTLAKKITCFYLDSKIEINLWEVKKYGPKPNQKFKKPFPMGAFLPIISSIISLGYISWMASLVYDIKPKIYRAAKRRGLYAFSEITEYHLGLIAASGIFANLLFAIIGYLIGFAEFTKLNIFYAFFNIIPFSDLDGNKIFFGSLVLWSFLSALILLGLGYVFLLG